MIGYLYILELNTQEVKKKMGFVYTLNPKVFIILIYEVFTNLL